MIDAELLKILACPYCVTRPEKGKSSLAKADLEPQGDAKNPSGLKCVQCGRLYKVNNGIPNLLVEEAVLPKGAGGARGI
jgi:uncharacterized protein YbaR (Trm112 family)